MIKSKRPQQEPMLTQAEVLNFKKLTLLQLEAACRDFENESIILEKLFEEIDRRIAVEEAGREELEKEIVKEKEIQQQIRKEYEQVLSEKPQKVIGDFEKKIEANFRLAQEMQARLEELDSELSIAKMERTAKMEQLCFKQSKLDSIELNTKQVQERIEHKKQEIEHIHKCLNKSTAQQQEMFNLKKKLNNELQEHKGNIRVYCRIRPRRGEASVINVTSDNTLILSTLKGNAQNKEMETNQQRFIFEQIFGEGDSQERVFNQISQLVQSSIDGKNVCIFAYGQTGSGKTHTLIGSDSPYNESITNYNERGITPRSLEYIFFEIEVSKPFRWRYTPYLTVQEIYLDTVIDLIDKTPTVMDKLKEVEVHSREDVQAYLREAKHSRKTATTNMNQRSSRSHLIVTLRLEGVNQVTNEQRSGSLVLVDLAGSERLKQSKVEGENLKETQFINKSLSSLGTVIHGIRKKSQHIPFRNSKLTHVLQRYLQGESKTLMFVNVSPDPEDAFQTKISLGFAQGVRECKLNKK